MRPLRSVPRQLTVAALFVGIVGFALFHPAPGHAAQSSAASRLLNQALSDARARGSFHEAVTESDQGTLVAFRDDVASSSGRQIITTSQGSRAEVIVSDDTAYIDGNQTALVKYFKFPAGIAAAIGSRWVSFFSSSSGYGSVAADVTVGSALSELVPAGHLRQRRVGSIGGQPVTAIVGTVPGASAGESSTESLYVTRGSTPLPLRLIAKISASGGPEAASITTLSDWGEQVNVLKPARAVPVGQLPELEQELAALAIPGASGYRTFMGSRGYTPPVGRPWGKACKPIRFAVDSAVPTWVYDQIADVVGQARKQGIDVTVESRTLTWSPRSLYYKDGQSPRTTATVRVSAGVGTPPKLADGKPQYLTLSRETKLDGDGHNEDLTGMRSILWVKALAGQPELVRRSIRQLIASTQGVAVTSPSVSGISNSGATDRFTTADIAAMVRMSGCPKPGTNLGLAA